MPDAALAQRRFVTTAEAVGEPTAFTFNEWLCRGDVVPCRELLLVRATMEPGNCHPFHHHPTREELIYVVAGRAEQWVGRERRVLGPGETAFIPRGEVHGTYNPFAEPLVFLAILAPQDAAEPAVVDVATEEPWASLRAGPPPLN